MRDVAVYLESGVAMASDDGTAAWVFDLDLWGRCGQGDTTDQALAALLASLPEPVTLTVAERIHGDERAFERDLLPASAEEIAVTAAILDRTRAQTIHLVRSLPREVLDADDPARRLPRFARWRTIRQIAWHIADTESRYYLPCLGLPSRPRAANLLGELEQSARHVSDTLAALPPDLVRRDGGTVWTSVKLLRRLAWHEAGELAVMQDLARRFSSSAPPA
jgi:hypothetical protein